MEWTQELVDLFGRRAALGRQARAEVAGDLSPVRQMRSLRGESLALPAAVLRAETPEDVAALMRFAGARALHVVVRGGGSGVVGGIEAAPTDIVLDVRGLDAIGPVDRESGLVTAQAGCLLGKLEERLAAEGLTLGHYPQSIALASLGGLVATRSSGQYSTRYGNIEQMIASVEMVTAGGERVRLGRAPRRSLGPEAWPLLVGAEGTLGVITSVTLSAWPLPEAEVLRSYAFAGVFAGIEAMRRLTRTGLPLGVIRLYDRDDALHSFPQLLPQAGAGALLLCSCLGAAEVAAGGAAAADRIATECGATPLGEEIGRHWLAARNDVSAWDRYLSAGVLVDTIECGAVWPDLAAVYEAGIEAMRSVPEVVAAFGHAAHAEASGASLYFTVGAVPLPDGDAGELQRRIWDRLLGAAAAAGASVGHHHGVGRMRKDWTWRERSEEIGLLQALRSVMDPGHLLNPGVLWPD